MSNDLTVIEETDKPIQREGMTVKQSAFVDAFVANGGQLTAAAREAGYAEASAHVEANRLMKNTLICKAIYEETMLTIGRHAPAALQSMARLSASAKSELVKMQASADILDRAGFKPIDRRDVRVAGDLKVSIDLT